jgi:hypothetical protein
MLSFYGPVVRLFYHMTSPLEYHTALKGYKWCVEAMSCKVNFSYLLRFMYEVKPANEEGSDIKPTSARAHVRVLVLIL